MPASVRFHTSGEHGTTGCTIGLAPSIYVGAFGEDAVDALASASKLASKMQAAIDKHPELKALIPPQAFLAFKAVNVATDIIKNGGAIKDIAEQVGPATAKAVHKLLSKFF